MGRSIESFRAEGEKIIKDIINYVNNDCKDCSKERRNEEIEMFLEAPISDDDIFQSYSLGFIELDEENSIPVINEEKLRRRIKGKNFEVLREMLLNKEMKFSLLDDILKLNGYYSMIHDYEDIEVKDIERGSYVIYTASDDTEAQVKISFIVTRPNWDDKYAENFYLEVTDFQNY